MINPILELCLCPIQNGDQPHPELEKETCVFVFVTCSLINHRYKNKPITSFDVGDKPELKETLTEETRQLFIKIEIIACLPFGNLCF